MPIATPPGGTEEITDWRERILEELRVAERGVTRFIVGSEVVTFSHLDNRFFPRFAFFTRSNGTRLSVDLSAITAESIQPAGGDPPDAAAPGILASPALVVEIAPEALARLYQIYTRIPRISPHPALTLDELSAAITFPLTPEVLREYRESLDEDGRFRTEVQGMGATWHREAQIRATLPPADPRRRDWRFLSFQALDINELLAHPDAVQNNIDHYERYPATIAFLGQLEGSAQQVVPHPRTQTANFGYILGGARSSVSLRPDYARFADTFTVPDYINHLIEITRQLRVYDEASGRGGGKIPEGMTLRQFLDMLRSSEDGGESQADPVASERSAIGGMVDEAMSSRDTTRFFIRACRNRLSQIPAEAITDADLVETMRRFQGV